MKKVLFMLYDLHAGGVEKALISLLKKIDNTNYSVDLLLLKEQGEFLEDVPSWVNIKTLDLPLELEVQLLNPGISGVINLIKKKHLPLAIKIFLKLIFYKIIKSKKRTDKMLYHADKILPKYTNYYDLAIDFQGYGSGIFSTFFISKKVQSITKASWIHQDVSRINEEIRMLNDLYMPFKVIFCVSESARREFVKKFPEHADKADVFYNIMPVSEIKQNALESQVNLEGNISILSIGRLTEQKGFDIALRAMKKLSDNNYKFKYYIIGEGEQRGEIERLISNYNLHDVVTLLGFRKNPYPYIQACDVYFQPSRFEGFCLTLGEAKIFNKPIVSTDFAGAREQIEDGKTGIIINCNEDEMFYSLKKMIDDPLLRETLSTNIIAKNKGMKNDLHKLYELM